MKILEYKATEKDCGKLVRQIIEKEFGLSSRTLSKLKKAGGIKVNDSVVTVRFELHDGDLLRLYIDEGKCSDIEEVDISLDVLYEDEDILLVNKPAAMPVHPSQNHYGDTLANAVMYRYRGEDFTFRAITRLDGDTTGVVLIARNVLSAQRLTDMLTQGKIKKEYAAVVLGVPREKKGVIDFPIARCEDSVIKRKVCENGKRAITEYEVDFVRSDGRYSLLKCFPITGRTHQIRLHLSHMGHPIYGDFLYGEPIDNVRAYLHCRKLTFPHPMTDKVIEAEAPLPRDIKELMNIKTNEA